ncbi:MAG: dihydropteroate synthase [Propionibacteriaceae bacterium]
MTDWQPGGVLRFRDKVVPDHRPLVMGIVNRTPDSFYDRGATFAVEAALDRVRQAVAEGADIVDIGGVKAGPGAEVGVAEEIRRTVGLVGAVRAQFPSLIISVDTWRAEVAREVLAAGADLVNDAWAGHDPDLAAVTATFDAALVCTHSGGLAPRTGPFRVEYVDVVADVRTHVTQLAERALAAGVAAESVIIDPAHDFGKNTWHSLTVTRRLDELVATGWPVLVSVSNKDFVGETLGLPVDQRQVGTQAATAVCAFLGARIHRVHDVAAARQTVDLVASVRGERPPVRAVRGLV